MKVFNATNPQAIGYIEDFLKPDGDYDLPEYVDMLKDALTYTQDSTYLPIILDGDKVMGFLIAIAPPKQEHVWIIQTWFSEELVDPKQRDLLFIKLILWSLQKGRRVIRGEVKVGDPGTELKAWDFKPYSQMLAYDIGDDFEERILVQRKNAVKSTTTTPKTEEPKPVPEKPKKLVSEVFDKKGK